MASVLLINPTIRATAPPNNLPLGIGVLASVLRDAGHEVEVYDCNALRPTWDEIDEFLSYDRWGYVGVGGLITTLKFQQELCSSVRCMTRAELIVGGGLTTSVPDVAMDTLCPDYAVIGEGEEAILDIVEGRQERGIVIRPKNMCLDSVPFPAWDLFPIEIYLKNPIWGGGAKNSSGIDYVAKRSMNTVSSRGCRRNCFFCMNLFGRGYYSIHSSTYVINQAKELIDRYNIDFLGFSDDNLILDRDRALDIANGLGRLGIKWGCHAHVTGIDYDLLCAMRDSGCVWIGFGFEHFHPKILKAMNKGVREIDNINALELVRKVGGIYPNTTFIYGYPGETENTAWYSAERMKDLGLVCPRFFATPYPGTPLYNATKHIHPEDLLERLGDATDFVVNLTDMNDKDLLGLKEETDRYVGWKSD